VIRTIRFPREPDRQLVHQARRILAIQTAAAIAVTIVIVGVLALVVVTRSQRDAGQALLRQTAATAEDVTDPPPDVWLFELDEGNRLSGTVDPPRGFPDRAAIDRVHAGGRTETRAVEIGDDDYLVLTRQRDSTTIQVIVGQRQQKADQRRLLIALILAEMAGLLVAILFATLLARRATAPLGDALARQRQFVADASHELRAPLTQLHTRAQLVERDIRSGATSADITDDISRLVIGTRHLGEVVEDLLLSTQLQHRADTVTDVDLAAVIADVITGQSTRATDGGVELTVVPDPAGPSLVRGREPALRRVLTALADNALSHTTPGGHVTFELSSQDHGNQVVLVVRDDGTGFDPTDAGRLFARFARASHDDHRRFGLGLALAQEVIVGHGGTIDATGKPGVGAAFTIRLPAAHP
jgi:two-component system OmpR family sensor kinase